jgi:glycosyltransferase involved in cell wall biosynthesis
MMPNVSIITPTYNRAHLLPRAWNSLRSQTEQNFQWIIVDDGSSDNTRKVVDDFNDQRIKYVYQSNTGMHGARNRGEREIKAEFVIYLDSDDEFFDAGSLEDMLHEIKATRPEIAWVSFTCVDEYGQKVPYLEVDRMEAGYIDHVCEQKFQGEFFSILRSDSLSISSWPSYNGFSCLRHWRIAKQRPTLLINRPTRIYHQQGDNLSTASSALPRATSLAKAAAELIDEHKLAWLSHCPCQLGKYSFYLAMYLALSGSMHLVLPSLFQALRYGKWNIRRKALFLFIACMLPLKLRQKLFLQKYNWNNR